jgi:hypothetical protein
MHVVGISCRAAGKLMLSGRADFGVVQFSLADCDRVYTPDQWL